MNDLLNNLEQAIKLVEKKKTQFPDSPTLQAISERYCSARNELKENGELKTSLIGGVKAYLYAFSDYEDNPLLDVMNSIETLLINKNNFKNRKEKSEVDEEKIFSAADENNESVESAESDVNPAEGNNEAEQTNEPKPSNDTEAILEAIAKLQQCFEDKIEEDAHKNQLFDNMHRELVRYQNGVVDKIIETLALDIIQLVDTTKGHIRVYEKKEPTPENYKRLLRILRGNAEDLQDVLYRQNIDSYSVHGDTVDTKRQKIIQILDTKHKSRDNLVAVHVAEGYEKEGKIIRPERIKIFKYNPDSSKEDNK